MNIRIGKLIIWGMVAQTLAFYGLAKSDIKIVFLNPWLTASQIASLVGTVLLAWTFILGSRSQIVENWFGGLDKMSRAHHLVGGIAFVLLAHHPLLLAIKSLPNVGIAANYLWFSGNANYNYGIIALFTMILILLLTFVIKLPYDLWLKSHDWMGVVLFFGCLHVFFISSDVSRYLPLRVWIFINLAVGAYAFVYKVFLYKWLGPKYSYQVEKTRQLGEILELYLTPLSGKVSFLPGQFAFLNFENVEMGEAHPFSFSSSPDDNTVRFSVKIMGDYTLKLKHIESGTKANLWGAYGKMYQRFRGSKEVVLIGGGIGITPFLSMTAYEAGQPLMRKMHLFYSAKTEKDAIYHQEILSIKNKLPNFRYYPYFGDQKPRLTVEDIGQVVGDLSDKLFYVCGPSAMMESITKQLLDKKVNRNNIICEDFAFK